MHAAKQSYYLPKVEKSRGIFNIKSKYPTVWNSIDEKH